MHGAQINGRASEFGKGPSSNSLILLGKLLPWMFLKSGVRGDSPVNLMKRGFPK